MPFSSESGKQYIKDLNLTGEKILDVGAGCGTYRKLLPNLGTHWTAVEVWEPYIREYGLNSMYNEVIIEDVRKIDFAKYDIAFVGDVLEHMTELEAINLVTKLKECARTIVVSIPLGYYPQDEYAGNPYEKHIEDHWTHDRVLSAFGKPWAHTIDKEIGIYVYRKLKVAIYAISKNEEMFIKQFCESSKDADLVCIADTGSTDNTIKLAKEHGAIVHNICITPWRFDKARDSALSLIPRDIDICIALDLDEMLQPGWRQEVERLWTNKITRLEYRFDWGSGIVFYSGKIHARHGYHWHHPCHEYPRPDGRVPEVWAHTDKLLITHHPDPTKSRGQYLDILKLAIQEDPLCPRNAFYYARELTFYSKWTEAITALNKYLAMPEAVWVNDRTYAMRLLGKCYEKLSDSTKALKWYRLACAEAPNTREPWVDIAMYFYKTGKWLDCFTSVSNALLIVNRELAYTSDPESWGFKPYDLGAIAAWNLGWVELATEYGEKAVELEPTDPRLKTNLKYYKGELVC